MFREDYVRRMIEQATAVITGILGLTKLDQFPEALVEVDRALQRFLGLHLSLVAALSASELVAMLRWGGVVATFAGAGCLALGSASTAVHDDVSASDAGGVFTSGDMRADSGLTRAAAISGAAAGGIDGGDFGAATAAVAEGVGAGGVPASVIATSWRIAPGFFAAMYVRTASA